MDRNRALLAVVAASVASLSARRAWIEIWAWGLHGTGAGVALRKESVDRNAYGRINDISRLMSLSARRAWIEIIPNPGNVKVVERRSPQGERG